MIGEFKIIDFHIHVGKKGDWKPWVEEYQSKINPELKERFEEIMSPDGLAKYLQENGVDFAVVLPEYSPITTGIVTTEFVVDFCKSHEMFIPFASINPHLITDPRETLLEFIGMGIKGVKIYPSYIHMYPNDPRLYPLYSTAMEHSLPVMFHTGSSVFRGARLKYADPIHLDDVAVDFPELPILLVHGGRGIWYETASFLARLHSNVYLEISGVPPVRLLDYYPDMERISSKVIFGSDWPGVPGIGKNIRVILDLPLKEETKRKILWDNAYTLLRRAGAFD